MDVDWNEPVLERWMNTTRKAGTKRIYKSGYRRYIQYIKHVTGKPMTGEQLIDEAMEDNKRDWREKKDILKTRLLGFHEWLLKEAPVRARGNYKDFQNPIVRKGVSPKCAHVYLNAVRSFYSVFNLSVRLKGRERIPQPEVLNPRMELTPHDVKVLVDHARSPRDRAIILTMFQGGMDVSTLCSMNYGHVSKGLAKNEHPLRLVLFRKKNSVLHHTFLGKDAIEAIKAWLNDAESRDIEFDDNSPLFVKEVGKGERITENLVDKFFRETAIRAGLVDENLNGRAINPVSPHALRESFGSIMSNNSVPDSMVNFWLGHKIGEMSQVYMKRRAKEVRQTYAEKEHLINVSSPQNETSQKVEELEKLIGRATFEKQAVMKEVENLKFELAEMKSLVQTLKEDNRLSLESASQKTGLTKEEITKLFDERLKKWLEKKVEMQE